MAWAVAVFFIAAGTFVAGVHCAILAMQTKKKSLGFAALILALSPWPVAMLLLQLASWLCGFAVSE
jgi:hypothetical protein